MALALQVSWRKSSHALTLAVARRSTWLRIQIPHVDSWIFISSRRRVGSVSPTKQGIFAIPRPFPAVTAIELTSSTRKTTFELLKWLVIIWIKQWPLSRSNCRKVGRRRRKACSTDRQYRHDLISTHFPKFCLMRQNPVRSQSRDLFKKPQITRYSMFAAYFRTVWPAKAKWKQWRRQLKSYWQAQLSDEVVTDRTWQQNVIFPSIA